MSWWRFFLLRFNFVIRDPYDVDGNRELAERIDAEYRRRGR